MNIEEAKERLKILKIVKESDFVKDKEAIEIVLEELNNSIPKSKIENKIKELEKRMKEEQKKTERSLKHLVKQEYSYRISGLEELLKEVILKMQKI